MQTLDWTRDIDIWAVGVENVPQIDVCIVVHTHFASAYHLEL